MLMRYEHLWKNLIELNEYVLNGVNREKLSKACLFRFLCVPVSSERRCSFLLISYKRHESSWPASGKGQEEKVTIQSLKFIFSTVGEECTINSTDPSYVFKFMLLVYNMISYHPEFQKWPLGLVAGCWGQEQMMSVTRRGHGSGQSAAPGPSAQAQVGSTPGCSETQLSFGP